MINRRHSTGVPRIAGAEMRGGMPRTLELIWVMPAKRGSDVFRRTTIPLSDVRRLSSASSSGGSRALDPYRPQCRIETDDLSTLIVGPPDRLFPAMRDLFLSAAATERGHCVLSATVSRGCPGEPDDPICTPARRQPPEALEPGIAAALRAVAKAQRTGRAVAAQFSLYPLGPDDYMAEIYGCIDFLKSSGVFGLPRTSARSSEATPARSLLP